MSASYNGSVIRDHGANRITIKSGGVIDILSGGQILAAGTQASAIASLTDSSGGTADDTLAVQTPPTALTDSSGGTPGTTLPAISGTYQQTEVRNSIASLAARQAENRTALIASQNNVADLAAKVNGMLAALRGVGIIVT